MNLNNIDIDSLAPSEQQFEKQPQFTLDPLTGVLSEAVKINPDQQVKINQLSKESGIPTNAVEPAVDEVESHLRLKNIDIDALKNNTPNTAQFMSVYDNATIAHDDIDALGKLETALTSTADVARSVPAGAVEGLGMGFSGLAKTYDVMTRNTRRIIDELTPAGLEDYTGRDFKFDPALPLRLQGEQLERLAETLGVPKDRSNYATDVAKGLGQVASQIATVLINPSLGTSLFFGQGVEQQARRQEESGTLGQNATTDTGLLLGGAATSASERIGIDKILNRIPSKIKNQIGAKLSDIAIAGGIEAVQEVAENTAHDIIELYTSNPDAEMFQGIEYEAAVAGGVGAIARAILIGFLPGKVGQFDTGMRSKQSQDQTDQAQIDDIIETANSVKLKERDKDSLKSFVEGVNEDKVYLDAEKTVEYLQTLDQKIIDADKTLQTLSEASKEAAVTGADLSVDMKDFVADYTGNEHLEALRPHMKLRPEGDTQFRQEEAQLRAEEYTKSLIEEAQQNASQYVEAQDIFVQVRDQLIDTGRMTAQDSKTVGDVVTAYFTVKAVRSGKSVRDVYEEAGLKIEGPMTGRRAEIEAEGVRFTQLQEAGFDVNTTWKHGTSIAFDDVDMSMTQQRDAGFLGEGFYVTSDDRIATQYAESSANKTGGNAEVKEFYVKDGDYKQFTLADKTQMANQIRNGQLDPAQLSADLQEQGYIGAEVIDANGDVIERVVYDVQSVTPVQGERYEQTTVRNPGYIRTDSIQPSQQYGTATGNAISVAGFHYSSESRTEVNTSFYGQGKRGQEAQRVEGDELLSKRSYFYVDSGDGIAPEAGTGGYAHTVQLNNVYDIQNDVDDIVQSVKDSGLTGAEFINQMERNIITAGYDGYYAPESMNIIGSNGLKMGAAVLIGDHNVSVDELGTIGQLKERINERLYQRTGDGRGREAIRADQTLEGAPTVEGATGPIAELVTIAEDYAKSIGVDYRRQSEYVEVDKERATRIAVEYEKMEHAPNDPAVKEAFENLAQQTMAQYNALIEGGYQFYFFDDSNDPYDGNPWNAMRDLRANKTMAVYATEAGFGSDETFDPTNNPLMADTGLTWGYGSIDGEQRVVSYNDLFRAVHDAFGHGLEGSGFRARGEENAWQAHVRLFTGTAVGAITSETRGQNSWLNFGPYGETNQTAAVEETVFADQKTGLMPEWTWTEGRAADMPTETKRLYQSPTEVAQRNNIGLYSGVEKAVLEMPLPEWKPKKNAPDTNEQRTNLIQERNELATKRFKLLSEEKAVKTEELDKIQTRIDNAVNTGESQLTLIEERQTKRREIEERYDGMIEPLEARIDEINKQVKSLKEQSVPMAKGPAILAKLKKMPGVKVEELEWLGVEEYLGTQDKFSRDDVVEFIRSNGVTIEQVTADAVTSGEDFEFDWSEEIDTDSANWEYRVDDITNELLNDELPANKEEVINELISNEENYIKDNSDIEDVQDMDVEELQKDIDVIAWVEQNFESELYEAYEARAETIAEEEYMDNPIVEYYDSETEITISGNEDVGFFLRYNGDVVSTDVWSFYEAEIQARDYARDHELIESIGDESVARWSEYVMEGDFDNYRELKLTLPEVEGDFEYDVHFEDRNLLTFLRVDDRQLVTSLDAFKDRLKIEQQIEKLEEESAAKFLSVDVTGDTPPDDLYIVALSTTYAEMKSAFEETGEFAQKIEQLEDRWPTLDVKTRAEYFEQGEARRLLIEKGNLRRAIPPLQKNTYFIDEFQSDWHQQGRQHGYQSGEYGREGELKEQLNEMEDKSAEMWHNIADEVTPRLSEIAPNADINTSYGAAVFIDEVLAGVQTGVDKNAFFEYVNGNPALLEYATLQSEMLGVRKQIKAESEGVPNAPFKGNGWMELGLKRAIIDAVEQGYSALAWTDSNVLVDRWSENYRKLYETQYDTKMPSMVKKLTKQKPVHLNLDGQPHVHQEMGYWVIEITPELKERVERDSFTLFQNKNEVRGYYEPANSLIRLTESSDLSTFLHEFAHFMYDMEKTDGGEMIVPINKWFISNAVEVATEASTFGDDVNSDQVIMYLETGTSGDSVLDDQIERATHEQFARGFESYLMEGKAPSSELRNVFRTIARWLTEVYKAVRGNLDVQVNDDIRKVFDKLLATDEQIEAAEVRAEVEPMFTDATMAGMTDEEFEQYKKKQQEQKDKATETLRDQVLKEVVRETKAWWNQEKSDMVDDEEEQLSKQPVYRARETLKNGTMKLDTAATKDMIGEEVTDKRGITSVRIPASLRGMYKPGGEGVHPDVAAPMFGYNTGQELLTDLQNAPKLRDQAVDNAQQRMIEKHGDIINDGTLEKLADEAVQNEDRATLMLAELKALNKGTNRATIKRQALQDLARENIANMTFRDINPAKYRRAEIKAAQQAAVALSNGDKDAAASAKLRQLLNFYLAKEAMNAKNDTIKIVDWMARYNKKSVKENIIKGGEDYWNHLNKILDRFEFRKSKSMKFVDETNKSIQSWIEDKIKNEGDGLVLTPEVLDEGLKTHWKKLPYGQLKGVRDSVKNIEHVARYANKVRVGEDKVDFNKLVNDWVDHMNDAQSDKFKTQRTSNVEGRSFGRWAMAQMTKIPYMASWLDGGERAGKSHDILVQPFNDAYDAELELWRKVGTPVMEMIQNRSKEDMKRHNIKIHIPEIADDTNDGNLYGHQVLAVALNTGNQGNLRKMLLGEGWANPEIEEEISIDNPKLQAVLSHMTENDWKMVQKIWDQMELLYPQLAEVHARTTGLTPPKVEATPVETQFGTFNGGYYPVKYDPSRSYRAELQEDKLNAQTESMFGSVGIQASVTAGATNERTGYYAPIRLSLDVVPNHFQETIHFITHHDAVRQTNRLIRNPKVAETIKNKLGPEEFAQLKPWLNDIAKDGREAPTKVWWESMLQRLRFGTTLGVMGFSASTGVVQILGLSNTMAEVGTANTYRAIRSILGSPETMAGAWEFAVANSKVMNHRMQTMDREIKNAMQKIEGKRGLLAGVQELSMKHIAILQTYMVDLPTWHAAYIKGMKDFAGDEQRAYNYADWAVENIQGSGVTKDMAQIMRNQNEANRMMTMFMTFFSALWNMERDLVRGGRSKKYSITTVGAKVMFLFTLPVFVEMILKGQVGDDDDDDETVTEKYLTNLALYPVASVPFVRDIAGGVIGPYGYNISPIAQLLDTGTRSVPELITRPFTDEEITQSQVKGTTKIVGAALGVPGVNQVWKTGEHLEQVVVEGEDLTLKELLYGPEK